MRDKELSKSGGTYHFGELETPSLVLPRLFCGSLQLDKESSLEVE